MTYQSTKTWKKRETQSEPLDIDKDPQKHLRIVLYKTGRKEFQIDVKIRTHIKENVDRPEYSKHLGGAHV